MLVLYLAVMMYFWGQDVFRVLILKGVLIMALSDESLSRTIGICAGSTYVG